MNLILHSAGEQTWKAQCRWADLESSDHNRDMLRRLRLEDVIPYTRHWFPQLPKRKEVNRRKQIKGEKSRNLGHESPSLKTLFASCGKSMDSLLGLSTCMPSGKTEARH